MTKRPLYKIVYSKKYRKLGVKYHLRHCVVLKRTSGRPRNVLVQLRGNELAIVSSGNLVLVDPGDAGRQRTNRNGSGWPETTERNRDWVREDVYMKELKESWGF